MILHPRKWATRTQIAWTLGGPILALVLMHILSYLGLDGWLGIGVLLAYSAGYGAVVWMMTEEE
jgi:hypothetical protein